MSTHNTINDKDKHGPSKDKMSDEMKKAAQENPELSPEELKKVVGGKLGAPIFKKKP